MCVQHRSRLAGGVWAHNRVPWLHALEGSTRRSAQDSGGDDDYSSG